MIKTLGSKIRPQPVLLIAVCLVVIVTHWPALSKEALFSDDNQYLTQNPLVQKPGWSSVRRFLTEVLEPSTVEGYYQPLTMISLVVDYALGGRPNNLQQFHYTSLALHAANTALVVVLLYLLFGQLWVAAAVGLLFGVHPMTVEPIVWVGERKTLLAAFFALWSLVLYVYYTRKNDSKLYAGCLILYVAALMSKPTSIPVPALMLLMDYWPLRRLKWRTILEKLPFFVIGGIFAAITYISQSRTAAVTTPAAQGAMRVLLVICHNIIFYLYKIVWPVNLSPFYAVPKPLTLSNPYVLAGLIGTCILIPLLLISLRWTRGLFTGWLFFFIAVFPAMGVVGFTIVIASDKFVYLPSVGLLMILTSFLCWSVGAKRFTNLSVRRLVVVIAVFILTGAEAIATRQQMVHWQDTETIYKYVLKLTPDAAPVHISLGVALESQGKVDEAISHYRRALQIEPDSPRAYYNLGVAFTLKGKLDEAVAHYRRALSIKPDYVNAHNNLGLVLKSQGRLDEAISHFRQALLIEPDHIEVHRNLGNALSAQGRFDESISHYLKALEVKPDFAEAHYNMALSLRSLGRIDEAIDHFSQAVRFKPNFVAAHNNLARTFVMAGRFDSALEHFYEALRLKPDSAAALNGIAFILVNHPDPAVRDPNRAIELASHAAALTAYNDSTVLETLAAACEAAGQFDRAVIILQKAVDLASAKGDDEFTARLRRKLHSYKQARPDSGNGAEK